MVPLVQLNKLKINTSRLGFNASRLWLRPRRRFAPIALALAGIITGAWLGRGPLLRNAADLWIVSDPVTHADAIVVLGGGYDGRPFGRPFAAADLYRNGFADRILISRASTLSDVELNREALLKVGVPAGAIETFGDSSKTTKDEAIALREWAEQNVVSVLIIPTEIFTARRVSWIFRRQLGTNVRIEVPSFEPPSYTRTNWWKMHDGVIAFRDELLKYIYYRLRY